jgi:hypothetical protein
MRPAACGAGSVNEATCTPFTYAVYTVPATCTARLFHAFPAWKFVPGWAAVVPLAIVLP